MQNAEMRFLHLFAKLCCVHVVPSLSLSPQYLKRYLDHVRSHSHMNSKTKPETSGQAPLQAYLLPGPG